MNNAMNKKKIRNILLAAAGVVALGVFGAAWLWFSDNRRSNFSGRADLYLRPGATVQDVRAAIPDSIVLRPASLRRMLRKLQDEDIRPGHYVVGPGNPSVYVPRMLRGGWQTPVNLVLSGTMRLKGPIARKVSAQLMVDSATVHRALEDEDLLATYGFTPDDVFSMILPDTYEMYWTASMKDVFDRLKKAYDAWWTPERKEKAKLQGLTQRQVSIVASIVSGESHYTPELPKIAGVYLNRYRIGMKLQADPTVAFCYDYTLNRILLQHLQFDSPYNTYLYEGLPPGPICVPPKECLEAVLNPDTHGYLYFCASDAMDGTHRFAVSYADHLRNADAFRRALDARARKNNAK